MNCPYDAKPRAHGPLSVVLVRMGIAEIDQQGIPDIPRDIAVQVMNNFFAGHLIGLHDLAQLFGVELLREGGGADQVTEHHRQLPPLAGIPSSVSSRSLL